MAISPSVQLFTKAWLPLEECLQVKHIVERALYSLPGFNLQSKALDCLTDIVKYTLNIQII